MRVIFTGQSGLNILSELQRFCNEYNLFTKGIVKKPVLFKVENYIEDLYKKDKKIQLNTKQTWKKFLREAYAIQEDYWTRAFRELLAEIRTNHNENENIFINLHAVYFHARTQEYLSLINIDLLKEFNPDKFITLIDDIYDIKHRLSLNPHDILYDRTQDENPWHLKLKCALNLNRVLDWRSKEIMMTRFIAKQLHKKNYVFAIKHSLDNLYNLACQNKNTLYLSHPISEPRRLELSGKVIEAEKIQNEITILSNKLCENFVSFLPTTIDEFRIKKEKDIFYSRLNKRWNDSLYKNPKDLLYSYSGFNDEDQLWQKNGDMADDEEFNFILKSLNDQISDQVTSRDYMLVEQSDILVVYRPLYNGNASGGVKEENKYHEDLERAAQIIGRVEISSYRIVFCPQEDINLYIKNQFNLLIEKFLVEKKFVSKNNDNFDSIEEKEFKLLLESLNEKELLLDLLRDILNNHKIYISNKGNLDTPVPLKNIDLSIEEIEYKFIEDFQKILATIDFYKQIATEFIDSDMGFDEFIEIIKSKFRRKT